MALKVTIPTEFGCNAQHWVVSKIVAGDTTSEITVLGYFNKAARTQNKTPLVVRTVTVNAVDLTKNQAYNQLKISRIVDNVETNPFAASTEE